MSDQEYYAPGITAVLVTYGARWQLLRQALKSALDEEVHQAIVVDNGSHEDIARLVTEEFGDWACTVPMGRNTGSACGFAAGISAAKKMGNRHVLLLDDDNILTKGSVAILKEALDKAKLRSQTSAVFGLRPDHGGQHVHRYRYNIKHRLNNSVFEFHILDLTDRIKQKLFGRNMRVVRKNLPDFLEVQNGPYGGLLFTVDLIDKIGLPDTRYVLYQDDTEFTHRIVKAGGSLLLIPGAQVKDAESSWHKEDQKTSAISAFLDSPSDFRIFYTFRNRSHLDRYHLATGTFVFMINTLVYGSFLFFLAIKKNKMDRFRLLARSWLDARSEHLGESPTYSLP